MSEKFLVAWGTGPSRQMTLSEINAAIASGQLSPNNDFWQEGRSRWEPLNTIPGITTRISASVTGLLPNPSTQSLGAPSSWAAPLRPEGKTAGPGFWEQSSTSQLFLWSAVTYTLVAIGLTPLLGSIFVAQNHRNSGERIWHIIPYFWIAVWVAFILAVLVDRITRGMEDWPLWLGGYASLWIFWFFTCALPHRNFINRQRNEVIWRNDLSKPLCFGFFGFVICFVIMLLAR